MNVWVETSFGEWLGRRRKAAGLTQAQLAREIGCSTSALKKIEAEQRRPSAQIVARLAMIFKIPSAEQSAFLRFARGDSGATFAETQEAAPWHPAKKPVRSNLPAPTTPLIGRAQEILRVRESLAQPDVRLITLSGPPGIGKTRLSIECARTSLEDFPDGVFFVALAPLIDPALIDVTIAHALGYAGAQALPTDEQLKQAVGNKRLLLVLDNCEHLIDACARLADAFLRACPNLRILATSQEALRIAGEFVLTVPPLTLPDVQQLKSSDMAQVDTVRLFVERARAVKPDFALTEQNVRTVAQICYRLDGIPLAIELAAARVKLLSVEHIAARLGDRLGLLTTGSRAAPPRHQTLRATIDWSYDLLPEEARLLFRRLGVFAGGFTLNAAEQICSAEPLSTRAVFDLLARLVDRSLVTVDHEPAEERYRMLQTIREYACAKLSSKANESGEGERTKTRHLDFFLNLAEQTEPQLKSAERNRWLALLDAERHNLRAALEWSLDPRVESELGLRLANALHEFWYLEGYLGEGRAWLEKTLARNDSDRTTSPSTKLSHRAKALYGLGRLASQLGDYFAARDFLESSLQLWRDFIPPDKQGLARTLVGLGIVLQKEGQSQTARTLTEEAVALFRTQGDQRGLAYALGRLGMVLRDQEDYALARRVAEEGAAISRALGDEWGIADALHMLGLIEYREGDYASGISSFEEAIAISRRLGERVQIAYRMHNLGILFLCQGDEARAKELNQQGEVLFHELGNKDGIAHSLYRHGHIAMFQDDDVAGDAYYRQVLEIARDGFGTGWLLGGCLFGFAMVAAMRGQSERAAYLWGAAEKQTQVASSFWDAVERRLYALTIGRAEKELGPETFAKTYSEGYAMTREQAIEYALEPMPLHEQLAQPHRHGRVTKQEFGGLTEREREVAARIAQGESNREITEALVVSERTVETHITNILNKLGFTSRAQIRKWAIEKGLGKRVE